MKIYEVEVHFIGEPDFIYFESRKDAEKAAAELNALKPEEAYFGKVYTTATVNEIELAPNQHLEGNQIITTHYIRRANND